MSTLVGAWPVNATETTVEATPSAPSSTRRRTASAFIAIVAITFAVYLASPVRLETDSYWVVFTARSLVGHGDADLDEYHDIIDHGTGFQVERWRGHWYYEAPLATSLLATPFVAVASAVDGPGLDHRLQQGHAQPLDGIIAAFLAAVTTGLVFLVLSRLTPRGWIAVVGAFIFAFGTQVWSTASRTMWMHTPSLLCNTLSLLVALRISRSGRGHLALGALLALAYFVRPTNVVVLFVFAIWVAIQGRRALLHYLVGAAVVAVTFLGLDQLVYGRPVQPYFQASRLRVSATTVEALLGNLVSPSRGLLVFVPVAMVCAWGVVLKHRARVLTSLDVAVASSAVAYWLVVSAFPSWWAGWSYGPRFLTDVAPFLVWFLPPVLEDIARRRRIGAGVAVGLVVLASVAVQAHGALSQSAVEWNWKPVDVGADHARLWDWSDPQFLR